MSVLNSIREAVLSNSGNRLQVKLYRSVIGLPKKFYAITQAIGLRRTHQTVFLKITPYNVGQLVKLKELVKIKLIHKDQVPVKGYLRTPPGFKVIGNMLENCSI